MAMDNGAIREFLICHHRNQLKLENIRKVSFLILIFVFDFCCLLSDVESLDTDQCTGPLGMETGGILDSDITASSSFDVGNTGPHIGRVRVERQGGAWCPKNAVTSEAEEWLQIDLHVPHVITATEIQGRFGNGQGMEYAEAYLVSYWRPTINKWLRYRDRSGNEILKGNINTYLAEKSSLDPAIIATKVRIMPHSKYRRTVCLRAEIYGCPLRGGLLSYSMPQGSVRGESWEFYDFIYDGIWDGHYLSSGLGALTDGRVGPTNLKDDFYNEPRGKGWVGWKRSKNGSDKNPLEIIFHFDSIREFNAVHIYASNQFTENVQVFSKAKVFFSVGGKQYSGEPITYTSAEDCIFETPKNVSIALHHRVGQYVKLQLYWASQWMLISEIAFDSLIAMGNFTAEEDIATTTTTKPTTSTIAITTTIPTQASLPPQSGTQSSESFKTKRNESKQEQQQQHHHHVLVHQVHQIPEDISVGASSRVTDGDWSVSSMAIVATAVLSSFIAIVVVLVIIFGAMVVRHKLITLVKLPGSSESSLHYGGASVSVVNGGDGCGCGVEYTTTTSSDESQAKTTQLSIATATTAVIKDPNDYDHDRDSNTANCNFSSFKGGSSNGTASSTFNRRSTFNNSGSQSHGQMAEFYSCSLVSNSTPSHLNPDSCNEYEYVLPSDFGKLHPHQNQNQHHLTLSPSRGGSSGTMAVVPAPPESSFHQSLGRNRAIHLRFRELGLPEISRHRLNILRNLGEGTFGTVFVGELAMPLAKFGSGSADRRLVIVKRMLRSASEKDKLDFIEEIRLLSALKDPNVTQVLGVSPLEEDPCSVILEFLEMGDLCQFLRQNDNTHDAYGEKLSLGDLLFIAGQIASGMKYFESRNIVHRDLAARNCVVGRGLVVKISHFASDMDVYASDYYRLDGKTPFPVRWMAWESIFLGKYSTKSDIWSFGVTLWEILCHCRHSPYHAMTNQDVITNLQQLSRVPSEDSFFEYLEKPPNCPRDIYQLMCDTWCSNDDDRPTFWEIHCFLSRKSITFCAEMIQKEVPAYIQAHAQQYIV